MIDGIINNGRKDEQFAPEKPSVLEQLKKTAESLEQAAKPENGEKKKTRPKSAGLEI